MAKARLPIHIKKLPGGGFRLDLGEAGGSLYIYATDVRIAEAVHGLTWEEAEELAKDVARALSEAWGR